MLTVLSSPKESGLWCKDKRDANKTMGYIPTMGALHGGHLSLVDHAAAENDVCCVSIFVNPLQFSSPGDLNRYPVSLERDYALLRRTHCDMVYTGTLAEFFPGKTSIEEIELLDPGSEAAGLEGEHRPGHLDGVVTIVDRLFRTVGPCKAYFGEKDYQQTLVVKSLAKKLEKEGLHIDIRVCPTIRENTGLAMSSRNRLLSSHQLKIAENIYKALMAAKTAWADGLRDAGEIETIMLNVLDHDDIKVEYAGLRDELNWSGDCSAGEIKTPRAFIAAFVGGVRLIDNMSIS